MGIASDVVEDLLRAGKRLLRVDDPLGLPGGREMRREGAGVGEGGEGSGEAEALRVEGLLQVVKQQAPEEAGRHAHGEEEAGPTRDPHACRPARGCGTVRSVRAESRTAAP
jgi:hypothetical protein